MRALVTGGAGFIGSHLTQPLLEIGVEVLILDDFSTGSRINTKDLETNGGLRIVEGSLLDEKLVGELMAQVDSCFHLGAALGVQRILEKPYQSLKTNVAGTENIIQAAANCGVKMFLASTSELYGKNKDCLLYTSPSPRDLSTSRMPSSA